MYEINDPDAARRYLLQSIGLSRGEALTLPRATGALRWALELASEGSALPPLGFICDFGHFFVGPRARLAAPNSSAVRSSASPTGSELQLRSATELVDRALVDRALVRRYEDYVLGKLYADLSLERAGDALQKYQGRERDRAIAFALTQVCRRAELGGALVGPAVIKGLLTLSATELVDSFENAQGAALDAALLEQWTELIQCVRNTGELLGAEDVFELERGTALSQFGQRMALRQVLQAAEYLNTGLPKQKPRGAARQYSVATNICQEDYYPVGGFTSISNRGTLESLLRSELAYMDVDQRPDLFDIKYVRDELLYYSRDDNRFFRRRVCFMFILEPELVSARVKDRGANWQRIIYTLAALVVSVRCLIEWLNADALKFEFVFLHDLLDQPLADERLLLETVFHEEIRAGNVEIMSLGKRELAERCQRNARQSLCHCTVVTASPSPALMTGPDGGGLGAESAAIPLMSVLSVADKTPRVHFDDTWRSSEAGLDPWRAALGSLFEAWL